MTLTASSTAQHLIALERANAIRLDRAALKREIRAGRRSASSVLRNMPSYLETEPLERFLISVPRYGRHRAVKLVRELGSSPGIRLGALTPRQREWLARRLG